MEIILQYVMIWKNDMENKDKWFRIIHHLISKSVTYGCDDSPSEEEGAAHVPVAGVGGCVSAGTNASAHGIYGVLDRPKHVSYQHQNPGPQTKELKVMLAHAGSADGIATNARAPCGFGESDRMSTPPANVYVELCTGVCYVIVQHSWDNAWGWDNTLRSTWRVTQPHKCNFWYLFAAEYIGCCILDAEV